MSVGIAFAGDPFPVHGSFVFGAGVKVARVVFLGHIRIITEKGAAVRRLYHGCVRSATSTN